MGGSANKAFSQLSARAEVTAEDMLEHMRKIGVDAAVVVPPYSIYGYDSSYAFEVAAKYPSKFVVVAPVDPDAPDIVEQIRSWRSRPGALGVRLVIWTPRDWSRLREGEFDPLFRTAEAAEVPVSINAPGHANDVGKLAQTYSNLQLILDHLGMATDGDPTWAGIDQSIALAVNPNVAVKISAVPVHSRQAFPFQDVWAPLHRVMDAFGIERCIWGSDWTRVSSHSYSEALRYLTESTELSVSEKAQILGSNLRRVLRWR